MPNGNVSLKNRGVVVLFVHQNLILKGFMDKGCLGVALSLVPISNSGSLARHPYTL